MIGRRFRNVPSFNTSNLVCASLNLSGIAKQFFQTRSQISQTNRLLNQAVIVKVKMLFRAVVTAMV